MSEENKELMPRATDAIRKLKRERDKYKAEAENLREQIRKSAIEAPRCQHGYTHGHSATCGGSSAGYCKHGYTHGHSSTCPGGQGSYGPTDNLY